MLFVRSPMAIYGALYRKYLWEPNIMENIWVMCGKYLCGLRMMYGLMWVFFVSRLMKLRPENLYLNNIYAILREWLLTIGLITSVWTIEGVKYCFIWEQASLSVELVQVRGTNEGDRHCFKNWTKPTGPTGWTRNQRPIWFGKNVLNR